MPVAATVEDADKADMVVDAVFVTEDMEVVLVFVLVVELPGTQPSSNASFLWRLINPS